ncbi:hypothetical protein [Salmonirosea aquatica]|uniref:Oligosaccharide flippase family protein n=1 Tax=Salmonirosea aquatica TaxID=2654236 RepID=A0A7C9BEA6_9BACT|nr:hypothetical protein [Cytophagaceae bacterium SJW1-29]
MINKIQETLFSKKDILITLFTRYSLYSIAIIESFLLPRLIDTDSFSKFEYYKNFIFIFPNFLLGSYSGYIYLKYVKNVDYYKQLFQIGSIISLLLACLGTIVFQNFYLFIPFLVFNIYTLAEQKLKIERKFIPIFVFKPILSILSVSIAVFAYLYYPNSYNYNWSLLGVFGIGFLLWVSILRFKSALFPLQFSLSKIMMLRYILMVRVIVTGVLASFLYSLLIFFERFYIKEYYADYLPTYSMAFNLTQIIAVLISAISYVSSVELGEKIATINKDKLINNFKNAFYLFVLFFIIFMVFVYSINPYYKQFEYLNTITFILSYSKGFFFLVGTISHLAVYNNFNTKMFLFLLRISIINVILIYILIFFNSTVFVLLILDSIFIIIYSLYILNIVFNKVHYTNFVK